MELAKRPGQSSEETITEHHEFYLPAMPSQRVVSYIQRIFAGLNRI